ncbi:MAG: Glycoside hydrolase starch-binding [Ignavibacteria bacterium]|nr:MAG: Glycoside hydrolase starch-binding [Ignavibacteria bacterium]KAF0161279.1 MAG: Glycoside hydrolase starch-binding [Ignavibacteria bacterium]
MKKLGLLVLLTAFFVTPILAQKVQITFKVNMKVQTLLGKFDPAKDVVSIPGSFHNWLNEPPANTTKILTADANKEWYSKTLELDAGKEYFFKFNIGTGWDGKDESTDRKYVAPATNKTEEFWYNDQVATGVKSVVEFRANMKLPLKQGDLLKVPLPGKVFVAGDFNGWSTTLTELTDADGDSIYTATIDTIKSAIKINYKFLYGNKANGTTWEGDPNKTAVILDGTNKVERFFNDVNPNVQLKDGTVSFYVDMSVLEQLKVYNPAVDGLQVRGGFNGWSDSDKDRSVMIQDFLLPTFWFLPVGFVKYEVNSINSYKFFVAKKDTAGWTDGWERPLSTGGGNREFTYRGIGNQETPKVFYDDVYPGYVLTAPVSIRFRVDMRDAFDPTKEGTPMKAADKLYWISEQPLFTKLMGWRDTDDQTNFELTDPDGDRIYEGTLTVKTPGFNAFEYRYRFLRAADKSWGEEPSSFGKNAYRVRFIAMTGKNKFVQPYTAPLDKWTPKADKSDQVETFPTGYNPTNIQELETGIPTKFSLDQNYPNPFNPTTKIKFAIPADENVSLKVFNVLGQEVATLVNKQLKAGSYSFDWNASNLSSGVYFYRIEAGSFNQTRKMLLLK